MVGDPERSFPPFLAFLGWGGFRSLVGLIRFSSWRHVFDATTDSALGGRLKPRFFSFYRVRVGRSRWPFLLFLTLRMFSHVLAVFSLSMASPLTPLAEAPQRLPLSFHLHHPRNGI